VTVKNRFTIRYVNPASKEARLKKLILLAGTAGLFLVGATVPQARSGEGELSSVVAAPAPAAKAATVTKAAPGAEPAPAARPVPATRMAENRASYPRCSATVRDRCIQGRGVAAPRYARVPERRIQLASRAGERG
jgi:hypothetical protein